MAEIKTETATNYNGAKITIETRPAEGQKVILVETLILAFLPIDINLKLEEDGRIIINDEKGNYAGQIATKHVRKDWMS